MTRTSHGSRAFECRGAHCAFGALGDLDDHAVGQKHSTRRRRGRVAQPARTPARLPRARSASPGACACDGPGTANSTVGRSLRRRLAATCLASAKREDGRAELLTRSWSADPANRDTSRPCQPLQRSMNHRPLWHGGLVGRTAAPAQGTAPTDRSTIVLLVPDNKTEDDYSHWSRQIGKPSELGVQLQVAISYSDRSGPHVVATGTVGVLRPPEDDFERHLLACKIADLVEAPAIAIFTFTGLLWWRLVKGGPFEVELTETRQLRQLDESEVSNVSMSGPGRVHVSRIGGPGRQPRFEDRAQSALPGSHHQHHRTLASSPKRNSQKHVVMEMLRLFPTTFTLRLRPPSCFRTRSCARRRRCRGRAGAGALSVKYGKADHMRRLYGPCGDLATPIPAVQDHAPAPLRRQTRASSPRGTPSAILPLFHAPKAQRDEVTCVDGRLDVLHVLGLFSDFGADA